MKKYIFLILLLFVSVCFAMPQEKLLVHIGGAINFTSPPKFDSDFTIDNTYNSLYSSPDNFTAYSYNIGAEMPFQTEANNFFTKIFGNENSLALNFSYLTKNTASAVSKSGQGSIWFIDGSRRLYDGTEPYTGYELKTKFSNSNFSLYFKGKKRAENSSGILRPYFGVVISNITEGYETKDHYQAAGNNHINYVNFDLSGTYFGAALGNQIYFVSNPRVDVFADINANLMYLSSTLSGYQNAFYDLPSPPAAGIRQINESKNAITFKATANLGINVKILRSANSPYISCQGGVNYWSGVPAVIWEEVNASDPGSLVDKRARKAELVTKSMLNPYVSLDIYLPLG